MGGEWTQQILLPKLDARSSQGRLLSLPKNGLWILLKKGGIEGGRQNEEERK